MTRLVLVLPLFALGACATQRDATPPGLHIGAPVQKLQIQRLAAVQSEPAAHFERTLLVEAKIAAVCQSMGCWMQVEDGGKTTMVRWEAGCGGQYEFPKDAAGERVLIQGSFYPKIIAKEDVAHLQDEAGKDVTIPEEGYEMNASAVVLLDRRGD
ncbi:MAG: DUF4920 domain-containing protein [Planctomycetota bacterium]